MDKLLHALNYLFYENYWLIGFIFSFIFGSCIGSFLNVVVWRLPRGKSLSTPASHCPKCNTFLKPWDNTPILGWLALRGKCRYCGVGIPPRYILVETFTACIFAALTWLCSKSDISLSGMLCLWILASHLICLSLIDFDLRIVPQKLLASSFICSLLLALLPGNQLFPGMPKNHPLPPQAKWLDALGYDRRDLLYGLACSLIAMLMAYGIKKFFHGIVPHSALKLDKEEKIEIRSEGLFLEDELIPWDQMMDKGESLSIYSKNEGDDLSQCFTFHHNGEVECDKEPLKELPHTFTAARIKNQAFTFASGDIFIIGICSMYAGLLGSLVYLGFASALTLLYINIIRFCKKDRRNSAPLAPFFSLSLLLLIFLRPLMQLTIF